MKLPPGKIPLDLLEKIVFKNLGIKRSEVVLGPTAGIDGAVIEVGDHSLIISMDPITGALERIGWLAVNVNANDVATFGVEPALLFSCILLPEASDRKIIETISIQMGKAAKKLGIAIAGGHCEVTQDLDNPIIVGCAVGIAEKGKYVTAAGARQGDKLILTKSAGIEGTAILASDRIELLTKALGAKTVLEAKRLFSKTSVVVDAITAFRTGGVDAMHDPTEGGIIGGIHEMAEASNLGVKVFGERIPVRPETVNICKFFKVNPLCLVSSGALLIAAKSEAVDYVVKNLKQKGIQTSIIGDFLNNREDRTLVGKNGKTRPLPKPTSDHLWVALAKR